MTGIPVILPSPPPPAGAMLAWFQRCSQTAGGATDPGEPNVPRTAYGDSDPNKFPLRQAVSDFYTMPEKDDSIFLTLLAWR